MDTSGMFKENRDDIEALISAINKVIYSDEFLLFEENYMRGIFLCSLRAEIIVKEIESLAPRGNFYNQYQVAWPSAYFKTHHEVTVQIGKLRDYFEVLKAKKEAFLKQDAVTAANEDASTGIREKLKSNKGASHA